MLEIRYEQFICRYPIHALTEIKLNNLKKLFRLYLISADDRSAAELRAQLEHQLQLAEHERDKARWTKILQKFDEVK